MKEREELLSGQSTFRRNPNLIGASIDDELVMLNIERDQYYGLRGVGSRLWELIEKPRSFSELVDQILEEYEVERETCEKDMAEFLGQMEELGLVERS